MLPIQNKDQLREAWYKFRDHVNNRMEYAHGNPEIRLNGAGAFVDFLCGRKPIKNTKYAKHERGKWPTD
jgi:hypothetical protein